MIDQSSYTIAVVDQLSGPQEPQALSYWAVSDVFEESFFPIHNESFHGMSYVLVCSCSHVQMFIDCITSQECLD